MSSKYSQLNDIAWLRHVYTVGLLNTRQIGSLVGCSHLTVATALRRNGIHVRTNAESKIGSLNSAFGRCCSEEIKAKISKSKIGKTFTEKHKHKLSVAHTGLRYGEDTKEKVRKARMSRKFPKHHTKPELQFETICTKYNLPFRYTGDSTLWIGRDSTKLNPDFCSTNGNKNVVVEVFGNWFHDPALNPKVRESATYEYRYNHFEGAGYKMIVFWESELKTKQAEELVLERLNENGFGL